MREQYSFISASIIICNIISIYEEKVHGYSIPLIFISF